MGLVELIIIAIGMSMDAFAVAVSKGLAMPKFNVKHALITGLWFGVFQSLMPFIGYSLGINFSERIKSVDHWMAFILLGLLGINMIIEGRKQEHSNADSSMAAKRMFLLAVATSIDALVVGVTFAFLNVSIIPAVLTIGFITFCISFVGVKIGSIFGEKFSGIAEYLGGAILIIIGTKILIEHTIFNG